MTDLNIFTDLIASAQTSSTVAAKPVKDSPFLYERKAWEEQNKAKKETSKKSKRAFASGTKKDLLIRPVPTYTEIPLEVVEVIQVIDRVHCEYCDGVTDSLQRTLVMQGILLNKGLPRTSTLLKNFTGSLPEKDSPLRTTKIQEHTVERCPSCFTNLED